MTLHTRWRGIALALGYSSYEIRQYSAISRGWFYREEFGKEAAPNRLSTSALAEHLERVRKLLRWLNDG